MACKHTYYEIVEILPSDLKAKMPLITILRYVSYIFLLFLFFIKDFFTFKRKFTSLFKKTEITIGRENNNFVINDFLEEKDDLLPTKTESKYFSIEESKYKLEEIKRIFKLENIELNHPLFIKERTEFFDKKCEDKFYFIINKFKIVETIKKYIPDPYKNIS